MRSIDKLKREGEVMSIMLNEAREYAKLDLPQFSSLQEFEDYVIKRSDKEIYIREGFVPAILKMNKLFDSLVDIFEDLIHGRRLFITENEEGEPIVCNALFLICLELENFLAKEALDIDNCKRLFVFRVRLKKAYSLYSMFNKMKSFDQFDSNVEYMLSNYISFFSSTLYRVGRIFDLDLSLDIDKFGGEYKEEFRELLIKVGDELEIDVHAFRENKEYSATSQILAIEYLLDAMGVRHGVVDKTNIVCFIQFITNRETTKEAKNTNIYKQLWRDRSSLKTYKKDCEIVSKMFEDINLNIIAQKIKNSIE